MNENLFNRIIHHKALYVVLGLIILAEVIWAGWVLSKPAAAPGVATQTSTTISLAADKQTVKVGEKVTVDIVISSKKQTDGTDIVLSFDSNLLSVATSSAGPVKVSSLYSEYPFNSVEGKNISVSGISSYQQGIIPNGLFGTAAFIAKKPGLARLNLLYTKDSTKDTIVVEAGTGKNILDNVENLSIQILP